MAMLLAAGRRGLWRLSEAWVRLPCPLAAPTLLARDGAAFASVDNGSRLMWMRGTLTPIDSGVEALLPWRGMAVTLSGETDCLTLLRPGQPSPLMTLPVGVYPQDACLMPDGLHAAVCGGADGTLRLVRLTDFTQAGSLRLPGQPQRITAGAAALHVLCLTGEHDLCTLLLRLPLHSLRPEPLLTLPGLPGAVCACRDGVWTASSETLLLLKRGTCRRIPGEFGLIRRMDVRGDRLLASDPVMDALWLVEDGQTKMLHAGDVQHGVFA